MFTSVSRGLAGAEGEEEEEEEGDLIPSWTPRRTRDSVRSVSSGTAGSKDGHFGPIDLNRGGVSLVQCLNLKK